MVHRYLMQKLDDENLRMFVVWGPMLGRETEEDAKQASALVDDPRAMHFWTDSNRVADLFQQTLGFTDEVESGWDTFSLYAPGTVWRSGAPPEPHTAMHVNKPLPEEERLDAIALAEVAAELLAEIDGEVGEDGDGGAEATGDAAEAEEVVGGPGFQPCELPGVAAPARCGTVTVWEDRQGGAGRRIDLRVAVVPAQAAAPAAPDPLFVITGGPGQSAIAGAPVFARLFEHVLERRDLVLVDQRGTGGSSPLPCPLASGDDPEAYLGDQFPPAAIESCLEALDADPRHYTTPVAMDDLDDVRAALGYETVNLFGLSYGSRAALVYLRRHPERVRSAILSGAVPTDMKVPTHHAPDAQRALDLLFDQCAADDACRTAHPDLREMFWTVWRRLDEAPVQVEIVDPATDRPVTVTLDRHLFDEEIRWRLYDQESNLVPGLVKEAHGGDFRRLTELVLRLRRALASSRALMVGTFLSVHCSEDDPFLDLDEARRLAAGTFLGTYRVEQQRRACSMWPAGPLPAGYTAPVRSDVPVLVLSGYRDPVTPPHWGERVLRHLPNGRHVVLRQGFHVDSGTCTQELVTGFVEAGSATALDASCAAREPATPFALPDAKTEGGTVD